MKNEKKTAILKSVLKLVNREGFYHLNMKKIAQEAGIATGTIYLYFDGKETLINDLYKLIVTEFNEQVIAAFDKVADLRTNFYKMIDASVQYYIGNPDNFSFVEQYTYAPFLFKESRDENFMLMLPIMKMIQKGKENGVIKDFPDEILIANIHGPINTMLKFHLAKKTDLHPAENRKTFYDAVWDNISIKQ